MTGFPNAEPSTVSTGGCHLSGSSGPATAMVRSASQAEASPATCGRRTISHRGTGPRLGARAITDRDWTSRGNCVPNPRRSPITIGRLSPRQMTTAACITTGYVSAPGASFVVGEVAALNTNAGTVFSPTSQRGAPPGCRCADREGPACAAVPSVCCPGRQPDAVLTAC